MRWLTPAVDVAAKERLDADYIEKWAREWGVSERWGEIRSRDT
jgi:hypothetical protein